MLVRHRYAAAAAEHQMATQRDAVARAEQVEREAPPKLSVVAASDTDEQPVDKPKAQRKPRRPRKTPKRRNSK
jgi:hypothetical protein